jgi:histidinol phosphatase-like enzyme (inositol monophosphatase family)
MDDGQLLMEAALECATAAGGVALRHFRSRLDVERKPDGSPVTIADREAEQRAREWIGRRFPQDGILGEEFGIERPQARRRWVLDPIDGTITFVRGVPLWGTLVAVIEEERVLAGAAVFPAVGERLCAAPGRGCWASGSRVHVSTVSELEDATLLVTDERFRRHEERAARWRTLAGRAKVARTWGDCYGYLLVATGRAEVMVDDALSVWDAAVLQPLIEEAGGVFTDWTGRRAGLVGDAIATNAALAETVRHTLVAPGGGDTNNA